MAQIMEFLLNLLLLRGKYLTTTAAETVHEAIKKCVEFKRKISMEYKTASQIMVPFENMLEFLNYNSTQYTSEGENYVITSEVHYHLFDQLDNKENRDFKVYVHAPKQSNTYNKFDSKDKKLFPSPKNQNANDDSGSSPRENKKKTPNEDFIIDNLHAILRSQEFLLKNVVKLVNLLEKDEVLTKHSEKLEKVKKKLIACTDILSNTEHTHKFSNIINNIIEDEITRCRFRHGECKTSAEISLKTPKPEGIVAALDTSGVKKKEAKPKLKPAKIHPVKAETIALSNRKNEAFRENEVHREVTNKSEIFFKRSKSESDLYVSPKLSNCETIFKQTILDVEDSKKLIEINEEEFNKFEDTRWHSLTTMKFLSLKDDYLNNCKCAFYNKRQFILTESAISKKIKEQKEAEDKKKFENMSNAVFEMFERNLLFEEAIQDLGKNRSIEEDKLKKNPFAELNDPEIEPLSTPEDLDNEEKCAQNLILLRKQTLVKPIPDEKDKNDEKARIDVQNDSSKISDGVAAAAEQKMESKEIWNKTNLLKDKAVKEENDEKRKTEDPEKSLESHENRTKPKSTIIVSTNFQEKPKEIVSPLVKSSNQKEEKTKVIVDSNLQKLIIPNVMTSDSVKVTFKKNFYQQETDLPQKKLIIPGVNLKESHPIKKNQETNKTGESTEIAKDQKISAQSEKDQQMVIPEKSPNKEKVNPEKLAKIVPVLQKTESSENKAKSQNSEEKGSSPFVGKLLTKSVKNEEMVKTESVDFSIDKNKTISSPSVGKRGQGDVPSDTTLSSSVIRAAPSGDKKKENVFSKDKTMRNHQGDVPPETKTLPEKEESEIIKSPKMDQDKIKKLKKLSPCVHLKSPEKGHENFGIKGTNIPIKQRKVPERKTPKTEPQEKSKPVSIGQDTKKDIPTKKSNASPKEKFKTEADLIHVNKKAFEELETTIRTVKIFVDKKAPKKSSNIKTTTESKRRKIDEPPKKSMSTRHLASIMKQHSNKQEKVHTFSQVECEQQHQKPSLPSEKGKTFLKRSSKTNKSHLFHKIKAKSKHSLFRDVDTGDKTKPPQMRRTTKNAMKRQVLTFLPKISKDEKKPQISVIETRQKNVMKGRNVACGSTSKNISNYGTVAIVSSRNTVRNSVKKAPKEKFHCVKWEEEKDSRVDILEN